MGDFANNMGDFPHGGFWILKLGILNVHQTKQQFLMNTLVHYVVADVKPVQIETDVE